MCERVTTQKNRAAVCKHTVEMLDVAERRITIPLLAVALLSLVQSKMIEIGEYLKGVFCLVGQTQSGKTQLYKMFFDWLFGRQTDTNFESTDKGIIRVTSKKRDSVATVDDYKPTSTVFARNNQMSKLEKIIRICSDDSNGYHRAGYGNLTIANIAYCILAITAEEIRLAVQSTLARMLIIYITRKSMNWDNLTYCQKNHDSYKKFIINYILYISAQGVANYCDNLKQKFLQNRDKLRSILLEKNKDIMIDNRTSDQCTWLYISFDLFINYALEVNAINHDEAKRFKQESLQIFLNIMEEQAERINELDDVKQFFRGLSYLLDTKEEHIDKLQARNIKFASEDSKAAIGFAKSERIYLKNEVAFRAVNSYFKRFGKDLVISESSLRERLFDNGLLVRSKGKPKSSIHRLYVNGENYQCIVFEKEIFDKLLKGDRKDEARSDEEIQSIRFMRRNADEATR